MKEKSKFNLQSTPMIHTPGILKWAMNGYHFKKDRKKLREVFKAYGLSNNCVHDLLSGKIPYEIVDEYDKSGYELVLVNN
jgi:hypothetical protein